MQEAVTWTCRSDCVRSCQLVVQIVFQLPTKTVVFPLSRIFDPLCQYNLYQEVVPAWIDPAIKKLILSSSSLLSLSLSDFDPAI